MALPIVNIAGLNSFGGYGNDIIAERLEDKIEYEFQYRGIGDPAGSPLITAWKFVFYDNGKIELANN